MKKSKSRESIAPQNQNGPKTAQKKRAFLEFLSTLPHMLTYFEKCEKKR